MGPYVSIVLIALFPLVLFAFVLLVYNGDNLKRAMFPPDALVSFGLGHKPVRFQSGEAPYVVNIADGYTWDVLLPGGETEAKRTWIPVSTRAKIAKRIGFNLAVGGRFVKEFWQEDGGAANSLPGGWRVSAGLVLFVTLLAGAGPVFFQRLDAA